MIATAVVLSVLVVAQEPAPVPRPDVQRLLEITGELKAASEMASAVALQHTEKLRHEFPGRAAQIVKDMIDAEFQAVFAPDGVLGRQLAEAYARHYTVDEINGLIAFYDSPLGRKVTATTPKLAQEGVAAAQKWAAGRLPSLLKEIQARLRTEGIIK